MTISRIKESGSARGYTPSVGKAVTSCGEGKSRGWFARGPRLMTGGHGTRRHTATAFSTAGFTPSVGLAAVTRAVSNLCRRWGQPAVSKRAGMRNGATGAAASLTAGFTLIELMVAVALFTAVMMIAIGSLIAIAGADRRAQALQTVIGSLNFAVDDMSRVVRTGTTYHCTDQPGDTLPSMGNPALPQNCPSNGSSYVAVERSSGDIHDDNDQVIYWINPSCGTGFVGGCIERSTDSGLSFSPITAPSIDVTGRFYIIGACTLFGSEPNCTAGDRETQPRILVVLVAKVHLQNGTISTMQIETTLTQRVYDA